MRTLGRNECFDTIRELWVHYCELLLLLLYNSSSSSTVSSLLWIVVNKRMNVIRKHEIRFFSIEIIKVFTRLRVLARDECLFTEYYYYHYVPKICFSINVLRINFNKLNWLIIQFWILYLYEL